MSNSGPNSFTISAPAIDLIKLKCLVLGDDSKYIFEIKIAPTESVNALQNAIKEDRRPLFDHVPANHLDLWNVENLPVDDALEENIKLCLEKKEPLSVMDEMLEVFKENPPLRKRLHIVVQGPPLAVLLKLNCFVLGSDPGRFFPVYIARTQTVGDLKYLIKEKQRPRFDHIPADCLDLWKVNLSADVTLEHNVRQETEHKPPLSPLVKMLNVFPGLFQEDCLHIVIKQPLSSMPPPPPPQGISAVRLAYADRHIETPSKAAIPSEFAALQKRPLDQVFCSRPREIADPIPVTLLEPIFAQFVDDCQNYEPTDDDHAFVAKLSHQMCNFYSTEPERLHDFRQIFQSYGITLHNATVGHMLVGTHVRVILEGKNEIGSGGAEPFAEAMLYYRKFLRFVEDRENMFKEHKALLPCFHIICFGACFGIVGSVFSTKVQCDILVPIIPLFWHSTDVPMETMAIRTLAAFKVAVKKLERLSTTTPKPIRDDGSVIYPYPQDYVDSEYIQPRFYLYPYPQDYVDSKNFQQTFTYDINQPFRKQLIFYGKDTSGARICVKFARTYSPEAHKFCADRGHAPKLVAYKPLSGGWNMIVMEFIDIDPSLCRPGSYRYFSRGIPGIFQMEKSITTLIEALHAEGYVHGDLRDVNIFVRVPEDNEGTVISNFMLIDFDWAGPVDKTRYPVGVNRLDVYRPENARGGHRILAKDDLDMLRYLFHPELCFGQKRKWDEAILSESADA